MNFVQTQGFHKGEQMRSFQKNSIISMIILAIATSMTFSCSKKKSDNKEVKAPVMKPESGKPTTPNAQQPGANTGTPANPPTDQSTQVPAPEQNPEQEKPAGNPPGPVDNNGPKPEPTQPVDAKKDDEKNFKDLKADQLKLKVQDATLFVQALKNPEVFLVEGASLPSNQISPEQLQSKALCHIQSTEIPRWELAAKENIELKGIFKDETKQENGTRTLIIGFGDGSLGITCTLKQSEAQFTLKLVRESFKGILSIDL